MNCSDKECCYYGQPKASSCECVRDKVADNGGPAFPIHLAGTSYDGKHLPQDGMTLRDYFAAKAMQGLCAGYSAPDDSDGWPDSSSGTHHFEIVADYAYKFADAMIKAKEAA